jgi:hypothetical protein
MEKHQKLQKRINEILLPNIEDRLVFGSTYLFDHRSNNIITRVDNDNIRFADNGTISLNRIKPELALGLPINLEMILLALKINKNHCSIDCSMIENLIRLKVFINNKEIIIFYKLNQPFLEQYQETQEALYKLFNIE